MFDIIGVLILDSGQGRVDKRKDTDKRQCSSQWRRLGLGFVKGIVCVVPAHFPS
ncbi:hypothetical protein SLEP1_g35472 [Rubroshorea leprosula]|uniref:Uncharacterized protein n=1 Tax=Rubroshorea leprosula TaxID=152421 RepID=A0AAV5KNM7_9ROSI|nr:hypothetical protein SLEP1_g35472 [Rubroshorea leprosula]